MVGGKAILLFGEALLYEHFLCTMEGPCSSYCCLVIHVFWKVEREATMEPPIHTEYLRSGGSTTATLIEGGDRMDSSFFSRAPKPAGQTKQDNVDLDT